MSIGARRAIVRWSWRLFRREWRQQLLVLILLTFTVATAIFGAVAVRAFVPSGDGEFGTATHRLTIAPDRPGGLDATLTMLRSNYGPVDVIGSRKVAVPGTVNTVEYRSQDPHGRYSAPMFALRTGRYPKGDEIALTDGVAARLRVGLHGHIALDGVNRAVVGLIENPSDLNDEFALIAPGDPQAVTHVVLLHASRDQIGGGPAGSTVQGHGLRGTNIETIAQRGRDDSTIAAVGALSLAMVVAILVCLVAAAGFVVVAQRRLRQLGMLAAIGATERHLRLVVLANGAIVGAAAAVVGAVLATVGWVAASPMLENAASHRLDHYDVPWWIVAAGMGLALATATAAAWWPGRTVSRVPITNALSERPPKPKPVHRSAFVATGLIAAGFAALAIGINNVTEEANALLVLPGVAALVAGMLLFSPLAIRALSPVARRAPIAVRLALRDLARHQARSGVALAAITLALGLAVSTVIIASANEHGPQEGNLSEHQLLVRLGDREPVIAQVPAADIAARRAAVDRLAATMHAEVVPLEVAITADAPERRNGDVVFPVVVLGRPVGDVIRDIGVLYVATPALTDYLGLDPSSIRAASDVLTPQAGALTLANTRTRGRDAPAVQHITGAPYSSAPNSLVTPAAMQRNGWTATPAGWLLETRSPLTVAQINHGRDVAVANGLTIETRDKQTGLASVRTYATAAGMALALAILAMTVGLIRGESASDLRTLTATGAASGTRRTIVAATAGSLGLLGVLIGTVGAYLALISAYSDDLHRLASVPTPHLLATACGVPLLAAGAAWLLAGRERPLARAVGD